LRAVKEGDRTPGRFIYELVKAQESPQFPESGEVLSAKVFTITIQTQKLRTILLKIMVVF